MKNRDLITLGFDGAQFHDSTGIVATHVQTGYQWMAGLWECPPGRKESQVPAGEVDALVRALFEEFTVWRLYADPPYWQSWIAVWRGVFGEKRVIEWWTNRRKQMSQALKGFHTAITDGTISHNGSKDLERHIGNSAAELAERDEQGKALWLIRKERPDSPRRSTWQWPRP